MTERMQRPSVDVLDNVEQPLMKIKLSYSCHLILPWDKGQQLMQLISSGEVYENGKILSVGAEVHGDMEFTMLPRSEYRNRKMAQLLNIEYSDLVARDRNPDDDNMPFPF